MADIHWLIDGWADKNLGLKADGRRSSRRITSINSTNSRSQLVRKGKAYVCDMTPEQTDEYRRLGKESPFRNRSVEENLDLLARMKAGEFPDGTRTLRAKIDMQRAQRLAARPGALSHPARRASSHRRTSGASIRCTICAHGLSDYIEGITHSICTLEFEVHRPLYDWILECARSPAARFRTNTNSRASI